MAVDYVRVVNNNVSVNIDLDGKMRTYSDIAEAAATKFLGMPLTEAHVPVSALSLQVIIDTLSAMDTLSSGQKIDKTIATKGAWFLLKIERAGPAPGA